MVRRGVYSRRRLQSPPRCSQPCYTILERVLGRQVINLEDYRCPSFKNLPRINEHFCFYHGKKEEYFCCALTHAYKIRVWLMKVIYNACSSSTSENSRDTPDRKRDNLEITTTNLCDRVTQIGRAKPTRTVTVTSSAASSAVESSNGATSGISNETTNTCVPIPSSPASDGYEIVYEHVNDELSADTKSSQSHTSGNYRRFSCGQDTFCVGEALCACN